MPTWENRSTDDADSDANRESGRSHIIDLDAAGTEDEPVHDPTIDAGWIDDPGAINAIGDTTWIDTDGDGEQDPGELPLAGVIIELIDPATGAVIASTVTDANGEYEFTNLPDGTYVVRFTLDPTNPTHAPLVPTVPNSGAEDEDDSDADPFTGMSDLVDLDSDGQQATAVEDYTIEAGYTTASSIGDIVWHDQDTDGTQDEDEPGIEGVTVELWAPGPDGEFGTDDDVLVATTTTDDDGAYHFDGLPGSDYRIRFDPTTLPNGFGPTQTPDGCDCSDIDHDGDADGWTSTIRLGGGEHRPDIDFGAYTDADVSANTPAGPLAFTGRDALDLGSLAALLLTVGLFMLWGARLARREDELV